MELMNGTGRAWGTVCRPAIPTSQSSYPGFQSKTFIEDDLLIQRDVPIKLSDGVTIYTDVIRPAETTGTLPVLLAWSPYGKHSGINLELLPGHEMNPEYYSKHYIFEAAEPTYWCKHGYALVVPDPRGTWASEGLHSLFSQQSARDACEVIHWVSAQEWSNGKVGMIGQSYFAIMQWKVAALRPANLVCIAPWGANADMMRHFAHRGGIPETVFGNTFHLLSGISDHSSAENLADGAEAHPFNDAYWEDKTQITSNIEVPAYVVADWTDSQVHNPGTMDGWCQIGSKYKWLEINGRTKWARFLEPEHADRLRQFYDTYLKGEDHGIHDWPRVRIEVRTGMMQGELRDEKEWPLARTQYQKLFLHSDKSASFIAPESEPSSISYNAETGHTYFDYPVQKDLEVTGYAKLHLWVEARGSNDMDLFVAISRINADGEHIHFPVDTIHRNGEVAQGWLRVSHRHQDPELSTEYKPILTHDREERLGPGQIVPVDIEIRPSGTLFRAGDTLRVVVQGRDIVVNNNNLPGVVGHTKLRNQGEHVIHMNRVYDSHLLLPVIL